MRERAFGPLRWCCGRWSGPDVLTDDRRRQDAPADGGAGASVRPRLRCVQCGTVRGGEIDEPAPAALLTAGDRGREIVTIPYAPDPPGLGRPYVEGEPLERGSCGASGCPPPDSDSIIN